MLRFAGSDDIPNQVNLDLSSMTKHLPECLYHLWANIDVHAISTFIRQ